MVRILFLHPDLGIGGAERLVVDAALALKRRGHEVSFLTNHHDPKHCFKETIDGSFLVRVVGDWLPRSIFGRFYALCAYFRMIYAAFYASFFLAQRERTDVVFCDLISAGIPILRLARPRSKIIYYCHFPDQLLSVREGYLKSVYRAPLNYLEEVTVGMADTTLVNSKFTLRVFRETFKRLETIPDVLYPSLNTEYYNAMMQCVKSQPENIRLPEGVPRNGFVFLDINRFERKKNHALAVRALEKLSKLLTPVEWKRCHLIIAGGYDTRVVENVEHYEELMQLTEKLNLKDNVTLVQSPSDDEKFVLLVTSQCLVYTPENEHFGIVPLEGMYMSKPVIAVNSGGPTETIVHNSTGILCENQTDKFAEAMLKLFKDDGLRERMGDMGHMRVLQKFSFDAFANKLDSVVTEVMEKPLSGVKAKDN